MGKEKVIEKWNRAIVHIETRPMRDPNDAEENLIAEYRKKVLLQELYDGLIPLEKYMFHVNKIQPHLIRYLGTAIFLKYNDKHYLISARHVVEDLKAPVREELTHRIFRQIML